MIMSSFGWNWNKSSNHQSIWASNSATWRKSRQQLPWQVVWKKNYVSFPQQTREEGLSSSCDSKDDDRLRQKQLDVSNKVIPCTASRVRMYSSTWQTSKTAKVVRKTHCDCAMPPPPPQPAAVRSLNAIFLHPQFSAGTGQPPCENPSQIFCQTLYDYDVHSLLRWCDLDMLSMFTIRKSSRTLICHSTQWTLAVPDVFFTPFEAGPLCF